MPSNKDIEILDALYKQQQSSRSQHSRRVSNAGPPSYYSATMSKTPPGSVAALSEASFVSSSAPPSSKLSKLSSRQAPPTASMIHYKAPSKASEVPEKDERLRGHSAWNGSDVYAGGDDRGPGEQSHYGDRGSIQLGRGDDRIPQEQPHRRDSGSAKSYHGSTHGDRRTREQSHHENEGGDGERHYGMPRESSPRAESVGGGGQPYYAESINDDKRSQGSGIGKPRGWQRNKTPSEAKSITISGNGHFVRKKDGSSKNDGRDGKRSERDNGGSQSGNPRGKERDSKRNSKPPSESGKGKTPSQSGKSDIKPSKSIRNGGSDDGRSQTGGQMGGERDNGGDGKLPSEPGKGKSSSQSDRGSVNPSNPIKYGGSQSGSQSGVERNDRKDKTPSQLGRGDIEPPESIRNGGSDYGGSQTGSRRGGEGNSGGDGKKVAFSSADNRAQPLDDIQECEREFERFNVSGEGRGTGGQVISTNWQAASDFLRKADDYESIKHVPRGKVLTSKEALVRKASGTKPQVETKFRELEARRKVARSWGK
ncbi:hypothetical protein BTUL_0041g00570 [Botrytis tulipae]|uniref:Uncharacterized protein n=1 Tax=Botrytis tulipae TaxID=87230 RepID=A0A4Z1EWY4_9HELO|nr:hypothetical protein BTUL_0041g00570 [Botrytis tulipae]